MGNEMQTRKKKEQAWKNKKYNRKFIMDLIEACEANVNSYVKEVECLLKGDFYARAFALAYCALEEMAKRLLCCDYYTNLISEEEFEKAFSDHKLKMAYLHNNCNITKGENGELDFEIVYDKSKYEVWFEARNKAMYVNKAFESVINPITEITKEDAENLYLHLYRIIQRTNYYEGVNERMGSKAFYK